MLTISIEASLGTHGNFEHGTSAQGFVVVSLYVPAHKGVPNRLMLDVMPFTVPLNLFCSHHEMRKTEENLSPDSKCLDGKNNQRYSWL